MTGSFPKYLVPSLRQTDFQALRAVKIGPLSCGGHASSAIPQGHWLHNPLVSSRCVAGAGGAVPARPLIPPSVRTGVPSPQGEGGAVFVTAHYPPGLGWYRYLGGGRFVNRPYGVIVAASVFS